MIEKTLQTKTIKILTYIFFILVFFFSRSFMGVYLFGFRIGELAIVGSLLILLISIINFYKIDSFKVIQNKDLIFAFIILIPSFFIMVFYTGGSLLNPYIFKSSSYIWTIGFLFFGLIYFDKITIEEKHLYIFLVAVLYIYYYSLYGIPENLQEIILRFSDKFEYHKGSDLLIMFVSTFFIYNRVAKNKRFSMEVFLCFSAIYFPLLLFKSRGAFIAFVSFLLIEIIIYKKYLKTNFKRNILLFILLIFLILQSTFVVTKSGFLKFNEVDDKVKFVATYRAVPQEETRILFIRDGRLYSADGNLNWRFQIWQDVIDDLSINNQLIMGYSFNEKIPAMDDPFRSGDDGTNENVHNYFINILARGGMLHLSLIFYLYYFLIRKNILYSGNIHIFSLLIPCMITSFFDASMENSHFPLIFYFVFAISFNAKKLFQNY